MRAIRPWSVYADETGYEWCVLPIEPKDPDGAVLVDEYGTKSDLSADQLEAFLSVSKLVKEGTPAK